MLEQADQLPISVPEIGILASQIRDAEHWIQQVHLALDGTDDSMRSEKALVYLCTHGETLAVQVPVEQTLKICLWRTKCECITSQGQSNGNKLHELQDMLREGRDLGLDIQNAFNDVDDGKGMALNSEISEDKLDAESADTLPDERRSREEFSRAKIAWNKLHDVAAQAERWQSKVESVLTTERVTMSAMSALLQDGERMPVIMEEK